jgi:hypothetical protein
MSDSIETRNMPSKPNYNHQRAERDRAKKAAKETKLRERKEQAALRKAGDTSEPGEASAPGEPGPAETVAQETRE